MRKVSVARENRVELLVGMKHLFLAPGDGILAYWKVPQRFAARVLVACAEHKVVGSISHFPAIRYVVNFIDTGVFRRGWKSQGLTARLVLWW